MDRDSGPAHGDLRSAAEGSTETTAPSLGSVAAQVTKSRGDVKGMPDSGLQQTQTIDKDRDRPIGSAGAAEDAAGRQFPAHQPVDDDQEDMEEQNRRLQDEVTGLRNILDLLCERDPLVNVALDKIDEEPKEVEGKQDSKEDVDQKTRDNGIKAGLLLQLDKHTRSRKVSASEKRRYYSNALLAGRLATWVIIFSMPVINYPLSKHIRDWSARGAKYMSSFSLSMSNFCWLLGPSLGATVRYASEAAVGQILALSYMLVLNWVFSSYMSGGAYHSRREMVDLGGGTDPIWQSSWLPVCNLGYGPRFVETNNTADFMRQCAFNIHWDSVTVDIFKPIIITVTLTLFVFVFLWAGFGTVPRLYALCYGLYWAMLFVNPEDDGFMESPTTPWIQSIMTLVGGFLVILSQILPFPNTALSKAQASCEELVESFSVLFEALPMAMDREVNMKMQLTLQAAEYQAANVFQQLKESWWEDMELGVRSCRRRKLAALAELLETLRNNMSVAMNIVQSLPASEAHQMRKLVPAIESVGNASAKVLIASVQDEENVQQSTRDLEEATADLQQEFKQTRSSLSPSVLVYQLVICSVASKIYDTAQNGSGVSNANKTTLYSWFAKFAEHLELPQTRRHPTHWRFCVRSTTVIMLSFIFGWIGFERALNAYEAEAAITVCIVVANTTRAGFSIRLILERLNSAVIGIVIGQAVGQVLAVQTPLHATLFSVFLWLFSACCIFLIVHTKGYAGMVLPVYAIGVAGLVPAGGIFREYNATITMAENEKLASTVKAAVFGGSMMLLIDSLFYSSARELAQVRVTQALSKCKILLSHRMDHGSEAATSLLAHSESGIFSTKETLPSFDELCAEIDELQVLLPHALNEPTKPGILFPSALFDVLLSTLRAIFRQLRTLDLVFSEEQPTLKSLLESIPAGVILEKRLRTLSLAMEKQLSESAILLDDLFSRHCQPLKDVEADEDSNSTAARLRVELRGSRRNISPGTRRISSRSKTTALAKQFVKSRCEWMNCCGCRKRSRVADIPRSPMSSRTPESARKSSTERWVAGSQKESETQRIIVEIRAVASQVRGDLPLSDRLSQIELILHLLQQMDTQLQTMNTAIAEWG
eukprot:TRINITY_DN74030_c0_g1_i1.p1 TRINITY_DN74030_c0_g1~~TRINITY_DN74030_c0_g1_i1.p1  ORF type:complete len:1108 (-),score=189.22 TRINITY_DN74030_c0_g1_i1:99-3422(-)